MRYSIGLVLIYLTCVGCVSYRLEHRLSEQVDKGRLTADLAVIALNHPGLTCPLYFEGNGSECPPGTSLHQGEEFNPQLPDRALFSLFFIQNQYDTVKDIIEIPLLLQALSNVPDPNESIMTWYRTDRSKYHTLIIPDVEPDSLKWTVVQNKMLTAFNYIQSWNFCPSSRKSGSGGIVHAIYKDRQITLYKTACNAGNLYGSNVKTIARSYRFFFVGAHELGHAIDDLSGQLDNSTADARMNSEKRANLTGLIVAKAVSRLMYKRIVINEQAAQNYQHYVPLKYDTTFISIIKSKNQKVERYFEELIQDAVLDIQRSSKNRLKLEKEFRGNYCLEY